MRFQRRNQAFPVHLFVAAFALHLGTEGEADVNVKAGHFAVAAGFGEWRIGAVGGEDQDVVSGEGRSSESSREGECQDFFHVCTLMSVG